MHENEKTFLDAQVLSASDIRKGRIANVLAVLVVLAAILVGVGFYTGSAVLLVCLSAVNILFGPVTLFFYLREVKRGVFRADADTDTDAEARS